jgi:ferredoxin
MTYHTITIEETGENFRCSDSETLLVGMERLGKRGIPVGCRGGGCGVCKVEIVTGSYTKKRMSREYVSEEDEAGGRVLACRVTPTDSIELRILGKMKKNVCAGATFFESAIDTRPKT